MFLVGLTGGIACGKSTVAKIFKEEYGCPVIDADIIARQVVEPGKPAYTKIKEVFGDGVFLSTGEINREKLGQIIFNDEVKRHQLNAIVHPAIKSEMLWQIVCTALKGHQFAILDIPLLFETRQMLPFVSFSIVVYCDEDQQLARLMQRNDLDEQAAQARISSQMSLKKKCELCTYVIDNTMTLDVTRDHVKQVHQLLQASNKHLLLRLGVLFLFVPLTLATVAICKFTGVL
ncbi:transposon ty3-i Gag-Pol polyprotein [Plakobranchus ocellatus]|uniref:Dephospho-CoA kinase domain-containing protein n=1 Tax=Plakobranchus ocellatus TaxID=259542 RepID=A0AAV3YX11_9GAST|nr:transposon ty3-i Gag-Pol polyprotein [Plakobranchus ocellatus]